VPPAQISARSLPSCGPRITCLKHGAAHVARDDRSRSSRDPRRSAHPGKRDHEPGQRRHRGIARAMALELAPVRVNVVSPACRLRAFWDRLGATAATRCSPTTGQGPSAASALEDVAPPRCSRSPTRSSPEPCSPSMAAGAGLERHASLRSAPLAALAAFALTACAGASSAPAHIRWRHPS